MTITTLQRGGLRVIGNFGMSFFSPLISTNILLNTDFLDSVIVSLISASIVTGFAISREVSMLGRK